MSIRRLRRFEGKKRVHELHEFTRKLLKPQAQAQTVKKRAEKVAAMSKDEDLMRSEDKIQKGASKMVLVLAPGAADASEGTVWVAEEMKRSS